MLPGHHLFLEYCVNLFKEGIFPSDAIANVQRCLERFITHTISKEQCSSELSLYVHDITPLNIIEDILTLPDEPIQPQVPADSSTSHDECEASHKKFHTWSQLEDKRLIEAIHRFGVDNWTAIARFVGNGRTRSQCSQRWLRGLDPKLSKSQWLHNEDQLLLQLVAYFGDKAWTQVAAKMVHRSDVQCRYRFRQLMKEHYNKSLFMYQVQLNQNARSLAASVQSQNIHPNSVSPFISNTQGLLPLRQVSNQHFPINAIQKQPFLHIQQQNSFTSLNFNHPPQRAKISPSSSTSALLGLPKPNVLIPPKPPAPEVKPKDPPNGIHDNLLEPTILMTSIFDNIHDNDDDDDPFYFGTDPRDSN